MGELVDAPLTAVRLPGREEMHKESVDRRPAKPLPPPDDEAQKCPRCDSLHTKFCYYNNYNLAQPRHFCKSCRRYWTVGGALRNIPVGGGTRKNARRPKTKGNNVHQLLKHPNPLQAVPMDADAEPEFVKLGTEIVPYDDAAADGRLLDATGTFSSLLASNGYFGDTFEFLGWPSGLMGMPSPGLVDDFRAEKHVCGVQEAGDGPFCEPIRLEEIKHEFEGTAGWSDFTISSAGKTFQ